MKRLLILVLIISLPVIAFFEWAAYRRAHFPADFIYQTADSIDLTYHDPEVVATYFESAADLERYGRFCWKSYRIDVRSDKPFESPEKDLVAAYEQKLAHLKQTEAMLKRSWSLKEAGWKAEEVELMLKKGLTESDYRVYSFLAGKKFLVFEDQGKGVFEVQRLLKARGYDLPVDGYFERQTREAVMNFQQKAGIYPTGKVGDLTIKKLIEE